MRLLETQGLKIYEFIGDKTPPYAILSHTWGEDEVSFQDMQQGNADRKTGYQKIKRCCELAHADGFQYVWIDTCCIDKSSSAELSEAINSMYRWYRLADVCYAYLADVPHAGFLDFVASVPKSRWFTRGWTLQELIAPSSLIFFDSQWGELGTKHSIRPLISSITSIDEEVLLNAENMTKFSVAQKMSWASSRHTTRIEDLAYCLMGIFGINMPLLYGEGNRAFLRLQEEILRSTNDATIFAWTQHWYISGLLTDTVKDFKGSGKIVNCAESKTGLVSLTNNGVQLIDVPIMRGKENPKTNNDTLVVLNCHEIGTGHQYLGIYVESNEQGRFKRVRSHEFGRVDKEILHKLERTSILVEQSHTFLAYNIEEHLPSYRKHYLTWSIPEKCGLSLQESCPINPAYSKDGSRIDLHGDMVNLPFGSMKRTRFSAFRFVDKDNDGLGLILLLKSVSETPTWSLTVNILEYSELSLEKLCQVRAEQTQDQPARLINGEAIGKGDRNLVSWDHPLKKWSVKVVVRRRIVSGGRAQIAHLQVTEPFSRE